MRASRPVAASRDQSQASLKSALAAPIRPAVPSWFHPRKRALPSSRVLSPAAAARSIQCTRPSESDRTPMRPPDAVWSPTFERTSRVSVYPDSVIQSGMTTRRAVGPPVRAVPSST